MLAPHRTTTGGPEHLFLLLLLLLLALRLERDHLCAVPHREGHVDGLVGMDEREDVAHRRGWQHRVLLP